MATISLCMIVKNEEETLTRCLNSVYDLVDEIIIVDTGSSDRTVEIAARFTEKIYRYPWNDDFAAARNESFSKASMDYCMWLDADDILEPAEREKFLLLKQSLPPDTDMVMMKYHTSFDETGKPAFTYDRERWISLPQKNQARRSGQKPENIPEDALPWKNPGTAPFILLWPRTVLSSEIRGSLLRAGAVPEPA